MKNNITDSIISKKPLIICICAAVLMITAVFLTAAHKSHKTLFISDTRISAYAKEPREIISFAQNLGYRCDTVSERKIIIPENFSEILNKYNDMQKEMGTDLRAFRGKQCRLFTLPLRDGKYMHLLCFSDSIIAGDIDNGYPDGIFYPLAKKNPPDIGAE